MSTTKKEIRLFDVAIKYLENIDFSGFSLDPPLTEIRDFILQKKYSEVNNETLNRQRVFKIEADRMGYTEYYMDLIFATAVFHKIFEANNVTSFVKVAYEIIEANKDVIPSMNYETFANTVYPKVMVEHWLDYCQSKSNIVQRFRTNSAFRLDIFFAMYHYYLGEHKEVKYCVLNVY